MGEDVADGRRPGGRPQPIGAACRVERFEHLEIGKFRQILFDRIIETEAALLDELHGRQRRDRLGHRCDAEQRVGRERTSTRNVGHAERTLIEDPPAIGDQRDHARYVLAFDRDTQGRVDAGACSRILRTDRSRRCRKRDSDAEDHSDHLAIHESLPFNPPPAFVAHTSRPDRH